MTPQHTDNPADLAALQSRLLGWFHKNKRDLPWRGSTPYAVLVSELMLQQTTVAAVVPYFQRWMKRFPSMASLARADEQEVLRHWAGLGYYARARNLHALAREVSLKSNGRLPRDPDALRALPGVGPYTAAAVASIACKAPCPAIDANAERVYSRLFAIGGDPKTARVKNRIREAAEKTIDKKHPGDFNQAVMELGAMVCTPRAPQCHACPVSQWCAAFRAGKQEQYPAPKTRKKTVAVTACAAVVLRKGNILLRRRPDTGPLPGLWEPPGGEIANPRQAPDAAAAFTLEQTGLRCRAGETLFSFKHTFTHHRITVHAVRCEPLPRARIAPSHTAHAQWVSLKDPHRLPLTAAANKIVGELSKLKN